MINANKEHLYLFSDASYNIYSSNTGNDIVVSYGGFIVLKCDHDKDKKCRVTRLKPIYEKVFKFDTYGNPDCNIYEGRALLKGLEYIYKAYKDKFIVLDVFTDSKVIVDSVNTRKYFHKSKNLLSNLSDSIFNELNILKSNKEVNFNWISRKHNRICNDIIKIESAKAELLAYKELYDAGDLSEGLAATNLRKYLNLDK